MDDIFLEIMKKCDNRTVLNLSKSNKKLLNIYENNKNSIYKEYLIKDGYKVNFIKSGKYYTAYEKIEFVNKEYCALECIIKNGFLDILKLYIVSFPLLLLEFNKLCRLCCIYNKLDMLEYLYEIGADLHYDEELYLRISCEYGHLDIVKYLCSKDCNVNAKNSRSLRIASENGYIEIVKILVKNGGDVTVKSNYCLRISVSKGYLITTDFLLKHVNLDLDEEFYNQMITVTIIKGYLNILCSLRCDMKRLNYLLCKEKLVKALKVCKHIYILDYFYDLQLLDVRAFNKLECIKNRDMTILRFLIEKQYNCDFKRNTVLSFYIFFYNTFY